MSAVGGIESLDGIQNKASQPLRFYGTKIVCGSDMVLCGSLLVLKADLWSMLSVCCEIQKTKNPFGSAARARHFYIGIFKTGPGHATSSPCPGTNSQLLHVELLISNKEPLHDCLK